MDINSEFIELQQIKFNLFKEQNVKTGIFDVSFEVDNKLIHAHKSMLNLVSATFASMFSDNWNRNKDEPIKIVGYGFNDFFQFITFLYSGKCQLTDTNIFTMVDIAEFYGVNAFKRYCDKYAAAMKLTTENIFNLVELTEKYSLIHLKASTKKFIETTFDAIINMDEFFKVTKDIVKELVVAHKYKAEPEDVFQAISFFYV